MLAALQQDSFRKPNPGLWDLFCSLFPPVDVGSSFFCGDAGGRKADFSDSDLKFAGRIGVEFRHAEDFWAENRGEEGGQQGEMLCVADWFYG